MNKVLVLGAAGHLGYNLIEMLVKKNYEVRAGVRSLSDKERVARLAGLGAEVVEADLLNKEQLAAAMNGVDGVFQLAAVFNVTAKNPEKDVVEPTITGTLNVIDVASKRNIKKLIYTSSIAAVGTVSANENPLDENSWNDRAVEPYAYAKTIAEKKAWDLAQKNNLNMVAVLPATMIGPGFFKHTPSTLAFELLLRGQVPFALPLTFEFVDVRDVAQAHILAYENKNAKGRYICSGRQLSLKELFQKAQTAVPGIKAPEKEFPQSLLGIVPFLDWLGNKLQGTPRFASAKLIKEYGNRVQKVSSFKIKNELGWRARSIDESIADTFIWVKKNYLQNN